MFRSRKKIWSVLSVLMVLSLVLSSVAYAAPLTVQVTAQNNTVYNYDYTQLGISQAVANHFKNSFSWAFNNGKKIVIDDSSNVKVDFDSTFNYGGNYADTVQAVLSGTEPPAQPLQPTHNVNEENGQAVETPVGNEALTVKSVSAIDPINVNIGTAKENIGLPNEVEITLSDDTKVNVPVDWACENYDPATAGTYTFVGTLDLSGLENVAATDKTASVDVVVAKAALPVESVSVINGTTVEATLAEVAATAPTVADFTVTIGEEAVAVTNVALKAGTDKTYTLTVALNGKEGLVKVNGVAAAAAVDFKAPSVLSVTNVDGNKLVVVFSEKVKNATTLTNYSLRNVATGKQAVLTKATADGLGGATSDIGTLAADGKTLTITLDTAAGKTTDYLGAVGLGTLDDAAYRLFCNISGAAENTLITDEAGNKLAINTYANFNGVISADQTAPTVLSATLDVEGRTYGVLKIKASELVKAAEADIDQSKISIGGIALTEAVVQSTGNADEIEIEFKDAAQKAAVSALTDLTVTVNAGAFKDLAGNNNTAGSVVATAAQYAKLTSATWNELNDTLTLVFDKDIDLSKFTNFAGISLKGAVTKNLTELGMALTSTANGKTVVFTASDPLDVDLVAFEGSGAAPADPKISIAAKIFKSTDGLDSESVTNGTLVYENDELKPVVTAADYDANTNLLHLTFNKKVVMNVANFNGAGDVAFFADGDNTTVIDDLQSLIQADLKTSAKATANFTETQASAEVWIDVATNAKADGKIEAITDKASLKLRLGNADVLVDTNGNKSVALTKDTQIAVSYTDTAVASAAAANHSLRLVKVTFDKAMDVASVTKDKFKIVAKLNPNDVKTVEEVIPTSGKTVFFLDLGTTASNQLTAGTEYKVSTLAEMTDAFGVKVAAGDLTGSPITAGDDATKVAASSPVATFVDNGTVGVNAGDKIVLTYAEPVTVAVDAATFRADNPKLGDGATIAVGDYKNQVVITIGGANITFKLDPGDNTGDQLAIATSYIKDYKGNELNAADNSRVAYPAIATKPTQTGNIVYADNDANAKLSKGDTITIPFDVELDSTQDIDESNIIIKNAAGSALDSGTKFTATASGKNLIVTFDAVADADATPISALATVAINGTGSKIMNLWGLECNNLSAKAPTLETATRPYITAANYDRTNKVLRITFSEAVYPTASPILSADLDKLFVLSAGYDISKDDLTTIALDAADTTNKTVKLTFTAAPTIDEGITTINVIPGGATTAADKGILDFDGNQLARHDANGVVISTYVAQ